MLDFINKYAQKEWILFGIYRPPSQNVNYFFDEMAKAIDHYSNRYEKFVTLCEFNIEEKQAEIKAFMEIYQLKNLIKEPTCFKSDNPKCIDLILTNRSSSFQNSGTIETGLSDFHSMIVTVLKGGFIKRGAKIILYRDYSKFEVNNFRQALKDSLNEMDGNDTEISEFDRRVETVLNEHTPIKKKYVRANDGPFMTKALRKAIYTRTNLRNRYDEFRCQQSWNVFIKMLCQANFDYYKADIKCLTHNRKFWKTVKPLSSGKIQASSKITLWENEVLVTDDKKVAEIFNEYFVNITASLGIMQPKDGLTSTDGLHDPVEIAIKKYSSHPSINLISENRNPFHYFALSFVTNSRVSAKLRELKVNKASPISSILSKILKENSDIFTGILEELFNASSVDGAFPFELKRCEVASVFKANDQMTNGSYRPTTVLSAISKVYERLMSEQIVVYSKSFLFQYLCGFREGDSNQKALVRFLENVNQFWIRKELQGQS